MIVKYFYKHSIAFERNLYPLLKESNFSHASVLFISITNYKGLFPKKYTSEKRKYSHIWNPQQMPRRVEWTRWNPLCLAVEAAHLSFSRFYEFTCIQKRQDCSVQWLQMPPQSPCNILELHSAYIVLGMLVSKAVKDFGGKSDIVSDILDN